VLLVAITVTCRSVRAEEAAHDIPPSFTKQVEVEDAAIRASCGRIEPGKQGCVERVKNRILEFRRKNEHLYRNLTSGEAVNMIRSGAVLLNGETCSGKRKVLVVRNRLFDWNRSISELFQWQIYIHEAIFHSSEIQERGLVVVQDVSEFGLVHMWQIFRSGGLGLLHYFPQHIVGIVIIGEPWFFDSFWRIAKYLLPEKERNMIKMLGDGWSGLAANVQEHSDETCSGDLEKKLEKAASNDELDGVSMGRMSLHIPHTPTDDFRSGKTTEL